MKRKNLIKAVEINSKLSLLEADAGCIRRIKSGGHRLLLQSEADRDDDFVIPERYQDRTSLFLERIINDIHEEINTLNTELESL